MASVFVIILTLIAAHLQWLFYLVPMVLFALRGFQCNVGLKCLVLRSPLKIENKNKTKNNKRQCIQYS